MIEIIPAIDLIDGKCVRLTGGDYAQKTEYDASPAEMAKRFQDAGIRRLHVVDLDGAKKGKVTNLSVLEEICRTTDLAVDFGGGIKTEQELKDVISAGAEYVTIGSLAVKEPEKLASWISAYGSDRFFIGADVRDRKLAVSGWLEQTNVDVVEFIQELMKMRVHYFFCTDISKDGMLQGPSADLYRHMIAGCPGIRLVASGGVVGMRDLDLLEQVGCEGVIIGKAIYEGRISLKEIEQYQTGIK